jgi:hypothetical protein
MKSLFFLAAFLLIYSLLFAQVAINTDGSNPNASAILDVNSSSKGLLNPRMTLAQIGAITGPADGLQVYCTTDGKIYLFVASANQWKEVA